MNDFASTTDVTVKIKSDESQLYFNMLTHVVEEKNLIKKQDQQIYMKIISFVYTASQQKIVSQMTKLLLKKNVNMKMTEVNTSKSTAQIVHEKVIKALHQILSKDTSTSLCFKELSCKTLINIRKKQWESQTLSVKTLKDYQEEGDLKRQRIQQRERQKEVSDEIMKFECCKISSFVFSKLKTFSDCYLDISDCARLAIHYCEHTESSLVTLHDFELSIFKLSELVLLKQVKYMLTVNHKFILHDMLNTSLLEKVFNKLCWTVRICWQFWNKKDFNFDS